MHDCLEFSFDPLGSEWFYICPFNLFMCSFSILAIRNYSGVDLSEQHLSATASKRFHKVIHLFP
ncbi:hypothetical protein BDV25DRAFT_164045 [Aspergillus avenaceus]|uniref:Uncharacterized protein n=1 Tax=Aspergillus avenaceus TaxID=36643 RepID=A0A5N6TH59_ASPAV|nr:hypothetical protein BDV25DRAFT_164045 [Aspergillus avenaceus]